MASLKDVEKDAFQLSAQERAILARNLLRSLDEDDFGNEEENEALWIEVANRRYQELKSGKVKGIPAPQVFQDARSRLK
jgi:putative addiction module component (TIGR02574 family)